MKRVSKYLFVFLIGVVLLTGCEKKEVQKQEENKNEVKEEQQTEKTMVCSRKATITEGVEVDLAYTVTYIGDYVKTVYSNEKVNSNNKEYLEQYKTQVESIYSPYKNIEYYDYNVRIEGNTLISEVTIQYDKIDTDKMIEIDSANATLIKDGKVKVSDIKTLYSTVGAICE